MIAVKRLIKYHIKPEEVKAFKKRGYIIFATEDEANAYRKGYKAGYTAGEKSVAELALRCANYMENHVSTSEAYIDAVLTKDKSLNEDISD